MYKNGCSLNETEMTHKSNVLECELRVVVMVTRLTLSWNLTEKKHMSFYKM